MCQMNRPLHSAEPAAWVPSSSTVEFDVDDSVISSNTSTTGTSYSDHVRNKYLEMSQEAVAVPNFISLDTKKGDRRAKEESTHLQNHRRKKRVRFFAQLCIIPSPEGEECKLSRKEIDASWWTQKELSMMRHGHSKLLVAAFPSSLKSSSDRRGMSRRDIHKRQMNREKTIHALYKELASSYELQSAEKLAKAVSATTVEARRDALHRGLADQAFVHQEYDSSGTGKTSKKLNQKILFFQKRQELCSSFQGTEAITVPSPASSVTDNNETISNDAGLQSTIEILGKIVLADAAAAASKKTETQLPKLSSTKTWKNKLFRPRSARSSSVSPTKSV